jgi:L-ascorbate metabolism protein UlaG (beta-lactamase superfamily)
MPYRNAIPLVALLVGCAGTPVPPSAASASVSASVDARAGSLQWRGGPTALIERDGVRLLTDPMLGPRSSSALVLPKHPSTGVANAPVARYTDPPADPLGRLDLVILSHNHADHFDQSAKDSLPKDVLFILPPSAVAAVQGYGFTRLRPLDWNQETVVELGAARLRITAVPAHHSHDPAIDVSVGKGNGYIITWEVPTPYVVYWTGDAILSDDMRQVAASHVGVDLWLPHLGAVGVDGASGLRTMDAEEAVTAMTLLRPRHVIPIHHTTFGHYREPVAAFVQRAASRGLREFVVLADEGETLALPQ